MKNNKFFYGVVVVFVVLFMFFAFFFGFRVVRAQFGVVGVTSVMNPTVQRDAVVARAEQLSVPRHVSDVVDAAHVRKVTADGVGVVGVDSDGLDVVVSVVGADVVL